MSDDFFIADLAVAADLKKFYRSLTVEEAEQELLTSLNIPTAP